MVAIIYHTYANINAGIRSVVTRSLDRTLTSFAAKCYGYPVLVTLGGPRPRESCGGQASVQLL